jgi:signal peptidase I
MENADYAPSEDASEDASESADTETAEQPQRNSLHEWWEMGKSVIIALAIALVIRTVLFQPFTIPSGSMEPTVLPGDYVIIDKFAYGYSKYSLPIAIPLFKGRLFDRTPKRGDIIVFKLPSNPKIDYIKRLVGLPGDKIQVTHSVVYVNGQPLPRQEMSPGVETLPYGATRQIQRFQETMPNGKTYVTNSDGSDGQQDNTDVFEVPAKSYFFMGDNRDNSADSRFAPSDNGVGYVPEENLVGRASFVLLSWNDKASIFKPWTWFLDLRLSRFFHGLK